MGLLAFVSCACELILLLRTALLWDITQRVVVISYRRCGTTHGPDFRSFGFLTPEFGTDSLSRNICKKLPLLAA